MSTVQDVVLNGFDEPFMHWFLRFIKENDLTILDGPVGRLDNDGVPYVTFGLGGQKPEGSPAKKMDLIYPNLSLLSEFTSEILKWLNGRKTIIQRDPIQLRFANFGVEVFWRISAK